MNSIKKQLLGLVQAVSALIKGVDNKIGPLDQLSTPEKDSIVQSINSLESLLAESGGTNVIDDTLNNSLVRTWSIDKIKTFLDNKNLNLKTIICTSKNDFLSYTSLVPSGTTPKNFTLEKSQLAVFIVNTSAANSGSTTTSIYVFKKSGNTFSNQPISEFIELYSTPSLGSIVMGNGVDYSLPVFDGFNSSSTLLQVLSAINPDGGGGEQPGGDVNARLKILRYPSSSINIRGNGDDILDQLNTGFTIEPGEIAIAWFPLKVHDNSGYILYHINVVQGVYGENDTPIYLSDISLLDYSVTGKEYVANISASRMDELIWANEEKFDSNPPELLGIGQDVKISQALNVLLKNSRARLYDPVLELYFTPKTKALGIHIIDDKLIQDFQDDGGEVWIEILRWRPKRIHAKRDPNNPNGPRIKIKKDSGFKFETFPGYANRINTFRLNSTRELVDIGIENWFNDNKRTSPLGWFNSQKINPPPGGDIQVGSKKSILGIRLRYFKRGVVEVRTPILKTFKIVKLYDSKNRTYSYGYKLV